MALRSSLSLNAGSTVPSVPRRSDGVTQTISGFWASRNHRSYGESISLRRGWSAKANLRPIIVKADATINGSSKSIAPLKPESPSGQFLVELLQSHPHLFSVAAEQQLEKLAEDREAATGQEQPSTVGAELVLYKRIAELRAQERRKTLEEIMYALISQRFVEAGICMVPTMSSSPRSQRVDNWPAQDQELESVHSDEALEMIREHLSLVLGVRGASDSLDEATMAQISKLRMGRVYAASAVYGYFLRRVDQRFQLEKNMKILPVSLIEAEQAGLQDPTDDQNNQQDEIVAEVVAAVSAIVATGGLQQDAINAGAGQRTMKTGLLRTYVMSFDAETLHRCATIRSKESVSVIEKHTEALFGKPEVQLTPDGSMAVAKDEVIMLSFSGLRRLVLEAVAFGGFLWDVETYVDTHYNIVAH